MRWRGANGVYEICVEDDGIGFEEKYLEKIFPPFPEASREEQRVRGSRNGARDLQKDRGAPRRQDHCEKQVGKGVYVYRDPASGRRNVR